MAGRTGTQAAANGFDAVLDVPDGFHELHAGFPVYIVGAAFAIGQQYFHRQQSSWLVTPRRTIPQKQTVMTVSFVGGPTYTCEHHYRAGAATWTWA